MTSRQAKGLTLCSWMPPSLCGERAFSVEPIWHSEGGLKSRRRRVHKPRSAWRENEGKWKNTPVLRIAHVRLRWDVARARSIVPFPMDACRVGKECAYGVLPRPSSHLVQSPRVIIRSTRRTTSGAFETGLSVDRAGALVELMPS
jgi:hypothetical protein